MVYLKNLNSFQSDQPSKEHQRPVPPQLSAPTAAPSQLLQLLTSFENERGQGMAFPKIPLHPPSEGTSLTQTLDFWCVFLGIFPADQQTVSSVPHVLRKRPQPSCPY